VLFVTTSRTPCHHRCYSRADAGRARSRAPIALTIAYSQASLCPGVLFSSLFLVGHSSPLCIHLLVKMMSEQSTSPRLRPCPLRPRLPRLQGAIICMWYSSVSTLVTTYAPSRRCNCGGCQLVGFYLRLVLQSHRLWCSRCDCGGMLEYI
jgi:hypothetical protein